MRFTRNSIGSDKLVLANDHFVNMAYDCSKLTPNSDGIIPAGTIVPANDATAVGVLFQDVVPEENPNGTITIHGFIDASKLPTAPAAAAKTALKQITFM
jgi:hypothetical protein